MDLLLFPRFTYLFLCLTSLYFILPFHFCLIVMLQRFCFRTSCLFFSFVIFSCIGFLTICSLDLFTCFNYFILSFFCFNNFVRAVFKVFFIFCFIFSFPLFFAYCYICVLTDCLLSCIFFLTVEI